MENLTLGWPQIIYLLLVALGFGVTVAKHGEQRYPHSVWTQLIGMVIVLPLLYWGGFFG